MQKSLSVLGARCKRILSRPLRVRRLAVVIAASVFALASVVPFAAINAAELLMFEEAGCTWCERWNEEIGQAYPNTQEGRLAPLRRLDIHRTLPSDLSFVVKGRYTPTFVLVDGGREIGRIRGYPGEDFFYPMLGQLLSKLPPKLQEASVVVD